MKKIIIYISIVIISLTAGYGQELNIQYNPIPSYFNVNLPNAVVAMDINYDKIDLKKQSFHIFLPHISGSFPLVLYIHGGGFISGSKDMVLSDSERKAEIKYYLENGVAYASIGYRLLETTKVDTLGVKKCLNDCKRALQFIRFNSSKLYINPQKIALTGSSAGAGTSLWLATRSDMADPTQNDPVLKESTRVCAAAISGSQATYDLHKWETEVYYNFDGQGTNYTTENMVNLIGFPRFSNFYGGFDSISQILHDPLLIKYRQDVDMLYHITKDDPPLYINSTSMATHPSQDLFHHAFHGREIYEAATKASITEVKAKIPAINNNTTQGENINQFILRHLTKPTSYQEKISPKNSLLWIQNYPNPFNASTAISWQSTFNGITKLEIFDVFGRKIKTIINEYKQQGKHNVLFDSKELPSGTYFYQLTVAGNTAQNKMMIIK